MGGQYWCSPEDNESAIVRVGVGEVVERNCRRGRIVEALEMRLQCLNFSKVETIMVTMGVVSDILHSSGDLNELPLRAP